MVNTTTDEATVQEEKKYKKEQCITPDKVPDSQTNDRFSSEGSQSSKMIIFAAEQKNVRSQRTSIPSSIIRNDLSRYVSTVQSC